MAWGKAPKFRVFHEFLHNVSFLTQRMDRLRFAIECVLAVVADMYPAC
jgi:hypothetical protein